MKDIVQEDPLVQKLFIRKQLTDNTKRSYITALTLYCELNQLNPSELRQEAYNEQLTIIDPLNRQIEKKLMNFYQYLDSKGLKNSTILHRLNTVRAFYAEYNVQLPDNIELRRDFTKKEKDLIKLKHIRQIVNNTSNIKYKAIISLMASSGIRQVDIINFKMENFIEATSKYHDGGNIKGILETLEGQEVIPIWNFKPQKTIRKGNIAITGSSPESTQHIITYLKTREKLYPHNPLFLSAYKEKYSTLNDLFENLNKRNGFGKNSYNRIFFHGHGLRDFFATTLNKAGVSYPVYKKMMGHSLSSVDRAYVHIDEDTVFEEYKTCVDKLSISTVKVHDFKTEEYLKLERKNMEYEKRDAERARENKELRSEFEELRKEIIEELRK